MPLFVCRCKIAALEKLCNAEKLSQKRMKNRYESETLTNTHTHTRLQKPLEILILYAKTHSRREKETERNSKSIAQIRKYSSKSI